MELWDEILSKQKDDPSYGYIQAVPHISEFFRKVGENSTPHMEKEWPQAIETNIPHILKCKRVKELQGNAINKVCIVVGASPALCKNWEALKLIEGKLRQHFLIFAINSSAGFLIDKGIIPDYIISCDADDLVWDRDLSKINKYKIPLLVSPFIKESIFKGWDGEIYVIPMGCPDEAVQKRLLDVMEEKAPIGGAGNAYNMAVLIATFIMQSRITVFVGNSLSWNTRAGESYYCDGRKSLDEEDTALHTDYFDIYGRVVRTTHGHLAMKLWLEDFASKVKGATFINATEDGIVGVEKNGKLPWIKQYYLKPLIKYFLEGYDSLKDWRCFQTNIYNLTWDRGYDHTGIPDISPLKNYDIKTILEVGCGNGSTIKEFVSQGYDAYGCDIATILTDKWNGISDRCSFAFADQIPAEDKYFDLVVTDILEHIPLDHLSNSIREIKRISKYQMFYIDYNPSKFSLNDQFDPHVVLRPPQWWRKELKRDGLEIISNPDHRTFITKGRT